MRTFSLAIIGLLLLSLGVGAFAADQFSAAVVFSESGFPAADTASPSPQQSAALLSGAHLATSRELATLLKDPAIRLLVLPYGSAFPEQAWPEILAFLQRGGNVLVLGGRPFTRSAYHDANGWKLRDSRAR
jgi:hypothetical protein